MVDDTLSAHVDSIEAAAQLGVRLADQMRVNGAATILDQVRAATEQK
jgi:hypothetical protein